MPRILLTEKEVYGLIAARKFVPGDVNWRYHHNEGYAKAEIPVASERSVNLKIHANVNMEEPTKFSFSLILSNAYRVKGLDVNGSHQNKHTDSGVWRGLTHKHRWSDRCRDAFAYTPVERIPVDSIDEAFRAFCQECNIEFLGAVKPLPPKQLEMKL